MMELARGADGRFNLAFGGDTFNTAVYAARMGLKTAYGTSLGDDPYSGGIIDLAAENGVDTSLISRLSSAVPGLYLIETKSGERTFYYWRDTSPARTLFEQPETVRRIESFMSGVDFVYFSGITLSIYSPAGLDEFERVLRAGKSAGAKIVFDSNYRRRGWRDDTDRARSTFKRFLALCDIALPSLDDEQMLWGDKNAADALARLSAIGVPEIVVKSAAEGAFFLEDGSIAQVPAPERIAPVDTTAAGDSFNAGYLARRAHGSSPRDSILAAHRLAGVVIRHPGAIAPKEATDALSRARVAAT